MQKTARFLILILELTLWLIASILHDFKGRVNVIAADVHLSPVAKDERNFFNRFELQLARFVIYQVSIM